MEIAPNFILKDQNGNDFELYNNLEETVLLVFYPKDESLVCTKQLSNYNDNLDRFREKGIKVVAINQEPVESHKKFSEKNDLDFPILSDPDKSVSKTYNAVNFVGLNKRKIVVINTNKKVIVEESVLSLFYLKTEEILEKINLDKSN